MFKANECKQQVRCACFFLFLFSFPLFMKLVRKKCDNFLLPPFSFDVLGVHKLIDKLAEEEEEGKIRQNFFSHQLVQLWVYFLFSFIPN